MFILSCMFASFAILRTLMVVSTMLLPHGFTDAPTTATTTARDVLDFDRFLSVVSMPESLDVVSMIGTGGSRDAFCRDIALPVCDVTGRAMYPEAKAFVCRRIVEACRERDRMR